MGKGFKELRTRYRSGALIRAGIFGISLGVLCSAAIYMAQKLIGLPIDPVLFILPGLGAAAFGFLLLALILYPSDKRVARRLDTRLRLNEKVQTMVAFTDKDSAMIEVQREDTQAKLGAAKAKELRTGREWINAILPVLAAAMLAAALIVPAKAEDPPEEPPIIDPDFDITAIQIQELKDLIQYVKGSNMEQEPKLLVVEMLEGLLADLEAATKESQMKEKVIGVITAVQLLLDEVNTSDDISFELAKSERDEVHKFALMIRNQQYAGVGSTLSAIKLSLTADITKDELTALVTEYIITFITALGEAGVEESDLLTAQIALIATRLDEICAKIENTAMTEIQTELKQLFDNVSFDIASALQIQSYNTEVAETVINTLIDIFGLSLDEVPVYDDEDAIFETPVQPPEDEAPGKGDDGGAGTGEMEYGSDDIVYDPATGLFVSYGTLINEYQATALALINEGKVPMSFEDFITDYFATLFAGFGEE